MKVTIRYNITTGDFKAREYTETFYAQRKWKAPGTSLVYFQIDRYNYKTAAENEIVSIEDWIYTGFLGPVYIIYIIRKKHDHVSRETI